MSLLSRLTRVVTKSIDDAKADWQQSMAKIREAEQRRPRYLPAAIVGESQYQDAIEDLYVSARVELVRELDNPFDADAIVVLSEKGRTIGYLPRDSWLRRALIRENKGCVAKVRELTGKGKKYTGVVLDVALVAGQPIAARQYKAEA